MSIPVCWSGFFAFLVVRLTSCRRTCLKLPHIIDNICDDCLPSLDWLISVFPARRCSYSFPVCSSRIPPPMSHVSCPILGSSCDPITTMPPISYPLSWCQIARFPFGVRDGNMPLVRVSLLPFGCQTWRCFRWQPCFPSLSPTPFGRSFVYLVCLWSARPFHSIPFHSFGQGLRCWSGFFAFHVVRATSSRRTCLKLPHSIDKICDDCLPSLDWLISVFPARRCSYSLSVCSSQSPPPMSHVSCPIVGSSCELITTMPLISYPLCWCQIARFPFGVREGNSGRWSGFHCLLSVAKLGVAFGGNSASHHCLMVFARSFVHLVCLCSGQIQPISFGQGLRCCWTWFVIACFSQHCLLLGTACNLI